MQQRDPSLAERLPAATRMAQQLLAWSAATRRLPVAATHRKKDYSALETGPCTRHCTTASVQRRAITHCLTWMWPPPSGRAWHED